MKAYLAIKFYADNKNRSVIETLSGMLEQSGFETMCVTRDFEQWGALHFSPQELMARSFAAIDSSDVVVIELSEKGVGLGIEAGYAFARQIPVVTIAKDGSDVSTTLRGISHRVCNYQNFKELADFFETLAQTLHQTS